MSRSDPAHGRLLVFTDLDGTLLTHHDYDWAPAAQALEALRGREAVLVIASSKTRAEIEVWRKRIGTDDPFISENGGALWMPAARAPILLPDAVRIGRYACVVLGTTYARLRAWLNELQNE